MLLCKHLTPPISFGQSCQHTFSHISNPCPLPLPFLLQIFHHLKGPQLFRNNQINIFAQLFPVIFYQTDLVTLLTQNNASTHLLPQPGNKSLRRLQEWMLKQLRVGGRKMEGKVQWRRSSICVIVYLNVCNYHSIIHTRSVYRKS